MKNERRSIWTDFLFSLVVAVVLIFAKEVIDEHTVAGQQLELATYGWLQHRLASLEPDAQLPLVILDISDLKPEPVPGAQKKEEATPRKQLQELLNTLILKEGAYAVGVDVDFSPLQDGRLPVTPLDHSFFDFCLDLQNTEHRKIYLGVYRTVLRNKDEWLGPPEYRELGASILAPRFEVTKMVNCIAVDGATPCKEDTLAALLAREMQKLTEPPQKHLVARIPFLFEQVSTERLSSGVSVGLFPVDYSQLKTLMSREHTFPSVDPRAMAESRDLFRNKIVLLGDANPDFSSDKFIVPGESEPIPGIYIHASAIYTLANAPLYQLSGIGRWVVDIFLALAVLGPIAAIRLYYSTRTKLELAHHRIEGWLILLVVLLSIGIAIGFVHLHRVLWTDFVLAIFALLLHPMGERFTHGISHRLGMLLPKLWRRLAFEHTPKEHAG
jgi:CHASE2 domain-containing sensor protein